VRPNKSRQLEIQKRQNIGPFTGKEEAGSAGGSKV